MSKPQHRRVRDAGIPRIRGSGQYLRRGVEFTISPCGKKDTVKFELSWWQIREMLIELRKENELHARSHEYEAMSIRDAMKGGEA